LIGPRERGVPSSFEEEKISAMCHLLLCNKKKEKSIGLEGSFNLRKP